MMTSSLRDAILAELARGPATLTGLIRTTRESRPAVIEAVGILVERAAVREVGEGRHKRLELVGPAPAKPTPMIDQWRALDAEQRALMIDTSAAVAESYTADLEAARAGDRRPFNVHACDVLGMATALLLLREQLASRDRALAAWEEAAHLAAPDAPVSPLVDELEAARATIAHAYRELLGGDRPPDALDLPSVCRAMRASLIERRRQVAKLERAASAGRLALVDELVRRGRAWIAAPAGAVIPADAESLADLATALLALLAYDDQHEPPAPTITDEQIRAERNDARFAGDAETARLCSAALGLEIGDGAHGRLDPSTCRERLARRLAHRLTASAPAAPATEPAP